MNSTPESYRRSSTMVPPLTEDAHSIEVSSTYSSPVSATTPQGPGYPSAGLVGLGISGLDDLRSFPSIVPYSVSPTLPTQLAPPDSLYNMPLKVDDYTTAPFLSVHNGLPAAPHSPLSFYGSQAMGASPSYNSSMEVSTGQNIFPQRVPGYWAPTPCSGPTSPMGSVPVMTNGSMGGQWGQPYLPEACITVNPPVLPVGSLSYPPTTIADGGIETGPKQPPSMNQAGSSPRSTTSSEFTVHGSPSKVNKSRTPAKKQPRKDKDKGYACKLCGYVFTRRSNCMEHQRKHDPRSRESHPCEECGKTFGRKADLKRHTNNVSKHTLNGQGTG